MRRVPLQGILGAALGVLACGAWGQVVPPAAGSDLLRSCTALVSLATKGGEITVDATSCAAYLKGLRDGIDASGRPLPERPFCASTASLDDMARAVLKHLQESPDNVRRHAAGEAMAALARAYPCAKKLP
jgi:hypothetical protein